MSVLEADDDYQAIGAWLERHEAAEMQRAYRREAERLLLWAIVERSKALSSLTREDDTAYRAFCGIRRRALGRTRTTAVVAGMEALYQRAIPGFHCLRIVGHRREVSRVPGAAHATATSNGASFCAGALPRNSRFRARPCDGQPDFENATSPRMPANVDVCALARRMFSREATISP